MILETTYTDKEVTNTINEMVGQPFGLWKRIKMGGIGSHRIMISEVSDELKDYINPGFSINNINIELRPNGIIIHLKWRTQTFGWVIPFDRLEVINDCSQINDSNHCITLINPLDYNKSFFNKLFKLKKQVIRKD
jgi:hypothetical protein